MLRLGDVSGPVFGVHGAGGSWDQDLNWLADKLLALVAEQPLRLGVDQDDPAVGDCAHHRVGSRFQERPEHAVGEHRQLSHSSYSSSDLG